MSGATTHREKADGLLAKILAAEAAATPAELRQMLADMRGALLAERKKAKLFEAGLSDMANLLSEVLAPYTLGDLATTKVVLDRILKERVGMLAPAAVAPASVAPAPEPMQ